MCLFAPGQRGRDNEFWGRTSLAPPSEIPSSENQGFWQNIPASPAVNTAEENGKWRNRARPDLALAVSLPPLVVYLCAFGRIECVVRDYRASVWAGCDNTRTHYGSDCGADHTVRRKRVKMTLSTDAVAELVHTHDVYSVKDVERPSHGCAFTYIYLWCFFLFLLISVKHVGDRGRRRRARRRWTDSERCLALALRGALVKAAEDESESSPLTGALVVPSPVWFHLVSLAQGKWKEEKREYWRAGSLSVSSFWHFHSIKSAGFSTFTSCRQLKWHQW